MKKSNKQIVPLCFLIAVLAFGGIIYYLTKDAITSFMETKAGISSTSSELQSVEQSYEEQKARLEKEQMQLKSIKQVFQTDYDKDSTDNLAMYGDMFNEIIKSVQNNGMYIRSIEYDTRPTSDSIYSNFSEQYNACELKFLLVGKYPQLRAFLNDVANNYKYLLSISRVNVTAFTGDTNYVLIDIGITLYSKKPSDNIAEE